MSEVLTVEQQLGRLHSPVPASEPALWQMPEFQDKWVGHPPIFDNLTRYNARSLTIGEREIKFTFLSEESRDAEDWEKHIIAGVIAYEWSHQFMRSENTGLFQEWVQSVPGWEKRETHG